MGAAVNPHLAVYRGNYLGFVVIGLLGTEFQQVGVSVLAQRIRMAQVMGTLEAEVATPAAPWMVLGAPPVYEFVVAVRSLGRLSHRGQVAAGARPLPRQLVLAARRRAR